MILFSNFQRTAPLLSAIFVFNVCVAQPGPLNTGHITPVNQLQVIVGRTITVDGTVVESFRTAGTITVKANNVTIRDCLFSSTVRYGVHATFGATGLVIEDCEFDGIESAAVYGTNFTARRLHIHNMGADAFKPNRNVLIEDSYIHHLGYKPTSHADGIQDNYGQLTVRGNFFDMDPLEPGYNNSIVNFVTTAVGPIDDVLIENNWLNGGGYTIQIRDKKRGFGAPTNVRILNNRFGRDAAFGPMIVDSQDAVICGNVWDDSGELLGGQSDGDCVGSGGGGTPTVVMPRSNPAGGDFIVPIEVVLTSLTDPSTIYYTLDGSDPEPGSSQYLGPVTISQTTTLKAVAFRNGYSPSSILAADFNFDPFTSDDEWGSVLLPQVGGSFTVSFAATPSISSINSVIGLSQFPANQYTELAAIVRFAESGFIDVRNGSVYEADISVPYMGGETYIVTLVLDVRSKTYTVAITLPDGSESNIAQNYAFRDEQNSVATLQYLSFFVLGAGTTEISQIKIVAPKPPTLF